MILHNYVHVFAACDRVSLIQDGVIALDKPTAETSVEELTEIVVEEYRRARLAARRQSGSRLLGGGCSRSTGANHAAVRHVSAGYAIGVDFGTESGRALLLDLDTGAGAGQQRRAATRAA